ncbi:MAG: (Fe-S)-binding protein [Verrucomicrobia bacterium]|nr:(Fe-S)-binding protein [Verrucomicrobiota bacterium]MBI3870369.1 (Fe-S)-binding protein [Verrucomicrobiota bacterium]
MSRPESPLKSMDYSVVQQCMHCGMCLPTCPTYDATQLERNSPRGRIALMRAVADDRLKPGRSFAEEMYFCLGCLACMTSCPAGVNYAELFERARAEAEASRALASPFRSLLRRVVLGWLFGDLKRLRLVGVLLRWHQQSGAQALLRRSGLLRLLPARLRELEAMTPTVQSRFSASRIPPLSPARGTRRFRVAMLTGCAQDLMFSDVNRDTVEALTRNGCEVATPPLQSCCGSLHAHNGEWAQAQDLARRQIDQFPPGQFDAIISNAAGCGSHLKHYSKLLEDDPEYRDRARLWDSKVKDIHEWLARIGIDPPRPERPVARKVTYHEACHLCHGQKIVTPPRELLRAIPGIELVELPESAWCCGSAGIYNLIQPEMAGDLLARKIQHVRSTGAAVVATGNPGCLLQIQQGLRREGLDLRVAHPVSLLAEAYRDEA